MMAISSDPLQAALAARVLPAQLATPPDDGALTAAACGGDHAAYAALYRRHAGRVYARLSRLVGPTCDREDLLQQVFLQLYRALPRFRADSSISTFIHGIVVHVALDYRRRQRRRPQDFAAYQLDELIDHSPTPEDHVRRRNELGQVLALIERITPDKRLAFTLVAIAGLSLEEAAGLAGSNADTIKQRVQRARRELLAMVARAERAGGPTAGGDGCTHDRERPGPPSTACPAAATAALRRRHHRNLVSRNSQPDDYPSWP